jgi:uncharacterized protein YneF (UPF0154 family)
MIVIVILAVCLVCFVAYGEWFIRQLEQEENNEM